MKQDIKRYTPEWYLEVDGQQEGPYSVIDLKRHRKITPDSLVWKEGFSNWVPIRNVPELKEVFEDEDQSQNEPEVIKPFLKKIPVEDEVLTLNYEPFQWFLWIIIVIIVMIYVFRNL